MAWSLICLFGSFFFTLDGRNVKTRSYALKKNESIYSIQLHGAHTLHYDLRLEIDNALVSFAIPKGPSLDPHVKRLAIRTPDHPLNYALFEGVLPPGYGAGPVMVWDKGTFYCIKNDKNALLSSRESLEQGYLEIFINGEKIHGSFILIQLKNRAPNQWLFIKMKDRFSRKNTKFSQRSVLTGRTLKQIESDDEN